MFGPSSVRLSSNSGLQEGGGSVFILLWAVSGHHYLTLQKERCKQMLAAHSAATVHLAEAEAGVVGKEDLRMLRSETQEREQTVVKNVALLESRC